MNESNETARRDFTNIVLDEDFKEFLFKQIKTAHDFRGDGHISSLLTYEIYHQQLKRYFNQKYNKAPTKTDKFAFVLLLTYPETIIKTLTSIKELKLAFNNEKEESDFEPFGFEIHDTNDDTTCICSHPIQNNHIFINRYSGYRIRVGSDCNERYGLISKNDSKYKSTCKKIKEHIERKKEREEGKPEGYYENERNKNKESKRIEKELKKLNKNKDGIKYIHKECIYCQTCGIYNSKDLRICNKCFIKEQQNEKRKINNLILNAVNGYCLYCENDFISVNNELCHNCCIKNIKIQKCKICKTRFCGSAIDTFCSDCENLTECITCKINIYKGDAEKQSNRCSACFRRFKSKLVLNICECCEDSFEVPETQGWKKYCSISCLKDDSSPYKTNSVNNSVNNNEPQMNIRVYLYIPFSDKDKAKELGCRWDASRKKWYCIDSDYGKSNVTKCIQIWNNPKPYKIINGNDIPLSEICNRGFTV